jgi:hypothetical protein
MEANESEDPSDPGPPGDFMDDELARRRSEERPWEKELAGDGGLL